MFRTHRTLSPAVGLVTLAAVSFAAAPAQVQVGERVALDFEVSEWINQPPLDLKHLKGRVIALAFIRLEGDPSLFFMENWDALGDEFAGAPVSFAAITSESPAYIREQVEIEGIRSAIAINPDDQAARSMGIQAFPSVVILDADSAVLHHDKPGSIESIRETLKEACRRAAHYAYVPPKQKSIQRKLDEFQAGKAWPLIERALGNKRLKDEERAALTCLKQVLEIQTLALVEAAERAIEREDWVRAGVFLKRAAEEHAGIPGFEKAKQRIEALLANEETRREIEAALSYAEGERYQRLDEDKKALRAYESTARLYDDTAAGKEAARQVEFLSSG